MSELGFDFTPLTRHHKIVLLTDGCSTPFLAKTAINLLRYRHNDVVAILDEEEAGKTAVDLFGVGERVPVVASIDDIPELDSVYIGIAPPGGRLPTQWRPTILRAIERGCDIVSGLHEFLNDDIEYTDAARRTGVQLIDVRRNRFQQIAMAEGFSENCIRIHTVGNDCSIGKMVVSLEVQLGLEKMGYRANFLATGQTGIMIAGQGVPVDCVVGDFINGAIEQLVLETQDAEFQLIEGQGSISHPAFSAVTVGLLHGCAPDGLIFCYEAGRTHVKGLNQIAIPSWQDQMDALLAIANLRHPSRLIGIAVNSRTLTADEAKQETEATERRYGLPTCDVYRDGPEKLLQACLELREEVYRERLASTT